MYLHADVNSMYASCEQLFRPDLKDKPVVVLSNNDGAVVAMNKAAKSLNIKRGVPYFQIAPLIKRYNVTYFSSNYALYGDMSARVMSVLESLSPQTDIYSIDEAFLHIKGINRCEDYDVFAHRVRKR
ncbi:MULTISPECIES: Y-family DNA polymerase [Limnobaculum]|uniref:Y-family DNA polymerase n=1 Tax=Limnobaculum TaxID=2172100 RepID=UPI001E4ED397|nr:MULTISPECIES: hypothetical protein [Limnobaculum]